MHWAKGNTAAGASGACWKGVRGVSFRSGSGGRRNMKTQLRFLATGMMVLMAAGVAAAQQAAPAASAAPDMSPVANPVSGFVKAGGARYQKNRVAAAEAMPAEKYSFK